MVVYLLSRKVNFTVIRNIILFILLLVPEIAMCQNTFQLPNKVTYCTDIIKKYDSSKKTFINYELDIITTKLLDSIFFNTIKRTGAMDYMNFNSDYYLYHEKLDISETRIYQIIIHNYLHDNIYSEAYFTIVMDSAKGIIFYKSTKDSFKSLGLDKKEIFLISSFFKKNKDKIIDFQSDFSPTILIQEINPKTSSISSVILQNYYVNKYDTGEECIVSYDFYQLLLKLTDKMRCNN